MNCQNTVCTGAFLNFKTCKNTTCAWGFLRFPTEAHNHIRLSAPPVEPEGVGSEDAPNCCAGQLAPIVQQVRVINVTAQNARLLQHDSERLHKRARHSYTVNYAGNVMLCIYERHDSLANQGVKG